MASGHKTEVKLAPELEAIATAACEQLRANTDGDPRPPERLQRRVGDAAGRAIAAGLSLTAIADSERIGHARAREQLGTEVLRAVERAAQRKREAERTYEQAVGRAARLGLVQRDIAAAAHVAHGTIRAVLARAQPAVADRAASTLSGDTNDPDREQQPSVSAYCAVVAEPTRAARQGVAPSSSNIRSQRYRLVANPIVRRRAAGRRKGSCATAVGHASIWATAQARNRRDSDGPGRLVSGIAAVGMRDRVLDLVGIRRWRVLARECARPHGAGCPLAGWLQARPPASTSGWPAALVARPRLASARTRRSSDHARPASRPDTL